MISSRYHGDAICLAAAVVVGCLALELRISVPEEITDYVSNGFMLPAYRYGLLFPLAASGIALSGERPAVLAVGFAVFSLALWFGLQSAEFVIYQYSEELTALLARRPLIATTMGMTAGVALVIPQYARQWFVPIVTACCGYGLGLSIIVESPVDYLSGWFSSASALGGMSMLIASIVLARALQQLCSRSVSAIAVRILGSWLIAASIMLAALAFVPMRQLDPTQEATPTNEDIDPSREP